MNHTTTAMKRLLATLAGLTGLVLGASPLAALAQAPNAYPAKPVSLMVPYPAGGPSDAMARISTPP